MNRREPHNALRFAPTAVAIADDTRRRDLAFDNSVAFDATAVEPRGPSREVAEGGKCSGGMVSMKAP